MSKQLRSLELAYPQLLRQKNELDKILRSLPKNCIVPVAKQQQILGLVNVLRNELQSSIAASHNLHESDSTCQLWQRRIDVLKSDCRLMILEVEKILGYSTAQTAERKEREYLLQDGMAQRRQWTAESALMAEEQRLDDSLNLIDQALAQGKAALSNLSDQARVMKGTRRKVKHALASAGVSSSIISSIESRLLTDRALTVAGMGAVTTLIYWFFCYWTGIAFFWWFPSGTIHSLYRLLF